MVHRQPTSQRWRDEHRASHAVSRHDTDNLAHGRQRPTSWFSAFRSLVLGVARHVAIVRADIGFTTLIDTMGIEPAVRGLDAVLFDHPGQPRS
jgi:hypothetical protein